MKIITFGGGTGHHQLALALKNFNYKISYIVGTWDNGGSTKYLRIGEKILAPGDIRNVYSALSNLDEKTKNILWDNRVSTGQEKKHSVGNIILASAIKESNNNWNYINSVIKDFLKINENHNVYPLTKEGTELIAFFEEGDEVILVKGESQIEQYMNLSGKEPLHLGFQNYPKIYEKTYEEIRNSDLYIIAPGSFYGSIYPHFLLYEVNKELNNKKGILITNIFNQGDFDKQISKLVNKIGNKLFVIYNHIDVSEDIKEKYKFENKFFMDPEYIKKIIEKYNLKGKSFDLIYEKDPSKHDPNKLHNAIKNILNLI